MIWSIGIASFSIGVLALKTNYNSSNGDIDPNSDHRGAALLLLIIGVFLFVSGLAIGIMWPFPMSGGVYNVLFSGSSALGGIILIAISLTLLQRGSFKTLSIGAALFGIYLLVVAVAISSYHLTKEPEFSALIFALLGVTAIYSAIPMHVPNKWLLRGFAFLAIITGILWIYFAAQVTLSHAAPPPLSTTTTPKPTTTPATTPKS